MEKNIKNSSGIGFHRSHRPFRLLQTLLVGLDHLLDHLAADGAGLAGGQVTVVAVLQVDANFPWCPFYILNSPDKEFPAGIGLPGANSLTGSVTISPMNL